MALAEVKEPKTFNKIDNLEFNSDNKLLQLLEIQYNKISEASRFNDKYQSIGKGTNKVVETIANSEKTKKVFEVIKGALTLGVIGYAAINNIGITETLGGLTSVIPGVGEGLSNMITSPGSNGIISQVLADSSLANVITKGIEEISEKKEMIKTFVIDKLPSKVKEKYFERENEKAEKRMQLEKEYIEDIEIYESNKELYNQKTKELLKDIVDINKDERKNNNQICFHHTDIKYVESILKEGLIPSNGSNSQVVKDDKNAVFFSEGMEGVIGLTSSFQNKFDLLKKENKIQEKNLEEYLGERIYLSFEKEDIENESTKGASAFIDGWTTKKIEPEKIKVCLLKHKENGNISYNRDDIVKYMMCNTAPEDIISKRPNDNKFEKQIRDYYNLRENEIKEFKASEYVLESIELEKFYENFIEKQDKQNPWKLSQEQIVEQSRKNEINHSRENIIKNQEDKEI